MTTRQLLAEYAALLNECGVDSEEADILLESHKDNPDFQELAHLSKKLKCALTAPACDNMADRSR